MVGLSVLDICLLNHGHLCHHEGLLNLWCFYFKLFVSREELDAICNIHVVCIEWLLGTFTLHVGTIVLVNLANIDLIHRI